MKKSDIIIKIKQEHSNRYSRAPEVIALAPGRINIIGEHTDYNDGLAMPAAINKYIFVSLSLNSDNIVNAYSDEMKNQLSFPLDEMIGYELWHKYIIGSVKEIFKDYNISHGLDILIYSNLPIGKGISSSAALEVALVNGILSLFKIKESSDKIIRLCQKIDHDYIGIKSGVLDQSASQLSKNNSVLKIDFNKNSFSYIKTNFSGFSWVLVDSMIRRELATSKYHDRVKECSEGLSFISNLLRKKISFKDISIKHVSSLADSHPTLSDRILHVLKENERVEKMERALINNNPVQIGEILSNSHKSLRDLYEVSCEEIDYLISISSKFKYWYGGRIMGGGFGGSTINLIKSGKEDEYFSFIKKRYKEKYNLESDTYNIEFSNGVQIIDNISAD